MVTVIQPFTIEVYIEMNRKRFRMQVKQIHLTNQVERFEVTGGGRSIVLQSDRPFYRNKGLMNRRYNIRLHEGPEMTYTSPLEKIVDEINSHIRSLEKPRFNYKDHPKNS